MKLPRSPLSRLLALTLTATLGTALPLASSLRAADHADAPAIDQDQGADIADAYLFFDPNDNTKVIIAMTVHGFIIPSEALGLETFDPKVKFYLNIENTGDAVPDKFVEVTFSPKTASTSGQTATVRFNGRTFTARTTAATLSPTALPQVVTTDAASGIKFFAGPVDDPFFFDVTAFNRFVSSIIAGKPDVTVFNRGRDTFAGYNIMCIALSIPVDQLRGTASTLGLEARTKRKMQIAQRDGGYVTQGRAITVDRTGNPTVNVALLPFDKKDAYNAAKTTDDAAGKFAPDIINTLKKLGTDAAHIQILADIAVTHGDFLHMSLNIANSGANGGINPEAAFPNGRRPSDDVANTVLTVVANGTPIDDHVDASDVPIQDKFPFFALPHQPLSDANETDDDTRN